MAIWFSCKLGHWWKMSSFVNDFSSNLFLWYFYGNFGTLWWPKLWSCKSHGWSAHAKDAMRKRLSFHLKVGLKLEFFFTLLSSIHINSLMCSFFFTHTSQLCKVAQDFEFKIFSHQTIANCWWNANEIAAFLIHVQKFKSLVEKVGFPWKKNKFGNVGKNAVESLWKDNISLKCPSHWKSVFSKTFRNFVKFQK